MFAFPLSEARRRVGLLAGIHQTMYSPVEDMDPSMSLAHNEDLLSLDIPTRASSMSTKWR